MKKFIIDDSFWELFPDAKIGVIVCNNIDNNKKDTKKYEKLVSDSQKEALKLLDNSEFSKNTVVSIWREAFKKFPTKKGARCSLENLMKRVHKGNDIGTINPLVDIYNSISLKYGLPCGGEDIDKFVGNIQLTKADGDEHFVPLGDEENKPPKEGEIVYKDDEGAICRCFNWREAERTMLTENTTNAFLIIELIDDSRTDIFNQALKELDKLVIENIGGNSKIEILDNSKKEITIE